MVWLDSVPIWFDYGASLDPNCQNVYRFVMKLEEVRRIGRVPSIVNYFMEYT